MTREADRRTGDRQVASERYFNEAWDEISERLARLRSELELAERHGLGEETREALVRKLLALQQTVDSFAERWIDFERRKKALEEKLGRSS